MANELQYITEDLQGMLALIYNGQCVGIQLPTAVDLKITQCDPAVKGNSATSRTKPATLETGLIVQVPEYSSRARRFASTRAAASSSPGRKEFVHAATPNAWRIACRSSRLIVRLAARRSDRRFIASTIYDPRATRRRTWRRL